MFEAFLGSIVKHWAVTGQAKSQEIPCPNDGIRRYVYFYFIHYACMGSPIFYNEYEPLL